MTRMKYERRQRRLSQHRLALAAELNQPYISLIECGRLVPTDDERTRIARVLEIAPHELLQEVVIVERTENAARRRA